MYSRCLLRLRGSVYCVGRMHLGSWASIVLFFCVCGLPLGASAQDSAAGRGPTLSLEDCRRLALQQNSGAVRGGYRVQEAELLVQSMKTKYLPRVDFVGGWYNQGRRDLRLGQGDHFLPIVPYQAIDPATGQLNPDYFREHPMEALKTLVIDMSTLQPVLDRQGNPIFRQYAYLPGDRLKLAPRNVWLGGFVLRQPIFTGLKILAANRMAESLLGIAQGTLRQEDAELIAKTDAAYWQVVLLQQKVKLARSYRRMVDRVVLDLKNLYEEGVVTRDLLLQAQVKQNEANLKVLRAEDGLELSRMLLGEVIGESQERIVVDDSALVAYALPEALPVDDSAAPRAELQLLQHKLELTQAARMMVNSQYMPDIQLLGGYLWKYPNPYGGLKNEFGGDWFVGVGLRVPILSWGDRIHQSRLADLKVKEARLELAQAQSLIALQVRQKRQHYQQALRGLSLDRLTVEQAEFAVQVARQAVDEGTGNVRDLLEAQVTWEQASVTYLEARVEACRARTELEMALGALYAKAQALRESQKGNEYANR